MSTPASPLLSPSQLAALAAIGEERSAPVGEQLYGVGDRTYPFVAILEGEVAIVDATGNELIRQGRSGFLGELNLLSGQTVFVNALVVEPLRYIAVERGALILLLDEDGPLSDLLLSTFISRREALQSVQGIGLEIVGPRGSEPTMRMLEFARANRLPYSWQETAPPTVARALVRLPGGGELQVRAPARFCGLWGSGSSSQHLAGARTVQLSSAGQPHQRHRATVGRGRLLPAVREPIRARELPGPHRRLRPARADDLQPDPLHALQRLAPGDEGGEEQVAERAVLVEKQTQRAALDRDVPQRLDHERVHKDRLPPTAGSAPPRKPERPCLISSFPAASTIATSPSRYATNG